MLDKFVAVKQEDVKLPEYLTEWGHGNHFPEPFEEIGFDQWISQQGYPAQYHEFRQVLLPADDGRNVYKSVQIFYYPHVALAYAKPATWDLVNGEVHWTDRIRYYQIGCKHEWRELTQSECRKRGFTHFGMCWHVTECPRCHMIRSYDSSG